MEKQQRRYDIDWLRVIAIILLIIYHSGIGFQPWGVFIGFIQNGTPMESLWVPMSMLNIWRIPLLFFVSGMGVAFSLRRRGILKLLGERARRILVPFIFGIIAIVPLHLLLWQDYYNQDLHYSIQQSHLWFLANIFSYVLILSPLFMLNGGAAGREFSAFLDRCYSSPLNIVPIIVAFTAEALLLRPAIFEAYALTLHGWLIGLLAFFFGYTFVSSGLSFWDTAKRWRWLYLGLAASLFLVRYLVFYLQSPVYLKPAEMVLWIFSAFGFAYKYFNRSSAALDYLNKAVYPVYIVHMLFLYLASYLIMPLDLSVGLKFILVLLATFTACFLSYEFFIRRIKFLRPLFGLQVIR